MALRRLGVGGLNLGPISQALRKELYAGSRHLTFDQPLHDRLLNEVLAADPAVPGLTLSNTLAQQQAKLLLNDDYF